MHKRSHRAAARYRLKQGILDLGPSGFPFERFVARILEHDGYSVKVGEVVQGQCVRSLPAKIAAHAAGQTPPRLLPDSSCPVITRVTPREITRIDTSFRFRGDGVIQQIVRQQHLPQAADEDIAWAQAMYGELGLL